MDGYVQVKRNSWTEPIPSDANTTYTRQNTNVDFKDGSAEDDGRVNLARGVVPSRHPAVFSKAAPTVLGLVEPPAFGKQGERMNN
jgi:hypothetical protein